MWVFMDLMQVKLVQHVYSCLFGEFLCNTERDRSSQRVRQLTTSVWTLLSRQNIRFVNVLYQPTSLQRVCCYDLYTKTCIQNIADVIFSVLLAVIYNQSTSYASIIWCLSHARINWGDWGRKGIRHENGGEMMEMEAPIVGMGWHPDGLSVCVCFCYLSLHHKIQKMASNNAGSW